MLELILLYISFMQSEKLFSVGHFFCHTRIILDMFTYQRPHVNVKKIEKFIFSLHLDISCQTDTNHMYWSEKLLYKSLGHAVSSTQKNQMKNFNEIKNIFSLTALSCHLRLVLN